jgi:hypothetical protein
MLANDNSAVFATDLAILLKNSWLFKGGDAMALFGDI